jgi:hypothetical protein
MFAISYRFAKTGQKLSIAADVLAGVQFCARQREGILSTPSASGLIGASAGASCFACGNRRRQAPFAGGYSKDAHAAVV